MPNWLRRHILNDMKKNRAARQWLEALWEFEAEHPVAFASPRALVEARLIARLGATRQPRARRRRHAPTGRALETAASA